MLLHTNENGLNLSLDKSNTRDIYLKGAIINLKRDIEIDLALLKEEFKGLSSIRTDDPKHKDFMEKYRKCTDTLSSVNNILKNWSIDDNGYLCSKEDDTLVEEALIKYNYLLKDGKTKEEEKEEKVINELIQKEDRELKYKSFLFGFTCASILASLGIAGYKNYIIEQGSEMIITECESKIPNVEIGDYTKEDAKINNCSYWTYYDSTYYENGLDGIKEVIKDLKDEGVNNADICIYLSECYGINLYDELKTSKKEAKKQCKIKFYQNK